MQNKIRHLYDIHQIMQRAETREYVHELEFSKLCLECVDEEIETFGLDEAHIYKNPLSDALIFVRFDEWMPALDRVYSSSFAAMTYEELPPLTEVGKTLAIIRRALSR